MKPARIVLFALAVASMAGSLSASVRQMQIYGIVERVVFEPNEKAPQRIKIWGSFALLYTNQEPVRNADGPYSPHRGYLYFKLPPVARGDTKKLAQEAAKREWADLKAVAGTGQAIVFGSWTSEYLGTRKGLRKNGFVSGKESLLVYGEKERGSPITYTMDTGIVKVQSQGKYAALITQLKTTLQR